MSAEDTGTPRERLLAAAIRLLDGGGPEALQARKVASEIGASSMAVYTHFGGMPALVEEVVREGFRRLDERLAAVPTTEDAVADMFGLGLAYRAHALENTQLYRLMFGISTVTGSRRGARKDMLAAAGAPTDIAEGLRAFGHLTAAVGRAVESGRITTDDPAHGAAQVWSAIHGFVLLEIAGFFGQDGGGVAEVFLPLGVNLAVGFGDDRDAALASARTFSP